MLFKVIGIFCSLLVIPFALAGENLVGVVKILGSDVNNRVAVFKEGETKGIELCAGKQSAKLSRLSRMTVSIEGSLVKASKKYPSDCFETSQFTVTRVTSGREPLIGVLEKKDEQYVLNAGAGILHELNRIPPGLRKLTGKKVIVDVKPHPTPDDNSKAWKVVTYTEYPE